jgi:hypothetical protein
MILTPLDLDSLPAALDEFAAALAEHSLARRVLRRVADSLAAVDGPGIALSQRADHHAQALALLERFGLGRLDADPRDGVTWDGARVAVRMEPSVVIHEVAHYQLAPPSRRHLVDFGLGAGPESGDRTRGEGDRALFGVDCDREEALASLLGVLWEAELGQPAILAFIEQNWLEGGASAANLAHFIRNCRLLRQGGFIDADGRPTMALSDEQSRQHRHQQGGDDAVQSHRQT